MTPKKALIEAGQIQPLIEALLRREYEVIGPTVRDGAIIYDRIEKIAYLPAGWTDEQGAGRYRLKRRDDAALFGYAVGPQSWKKYLHPAHVRLFAAERDGAAFRVLNSDSPRPGRRYAFLGVRSCDLAAIATQDRVLLGDRYRDPIYQRRREGNFIVAVNCTQSAATCFCASMGTGPRALGGYDLAVTELLDSGSHRFVIEAATEAGAEVLGELEQTEISVEAEREAEAAVERTAAGMQRTLDNTDIRDLLLYENFEHPRWQDVARRCLTCGNCTLVCPTCFCTTVEDMSDVSGDHAERWRKWDSCFTEDFSYIHGGSVRASSLGRYRQWMTHKLASWIDQFGSSGCVGCGRCITWCPVGIDITEEVRAIREGNAPPGENKHGDT
jgi:sulfhydrogenase subunit beta (sulfur reductase)